MSRPASSARVSSRNTTRPRWCHQAPVPNWTRTARLSSSLVPQCPNSRQKRPCWAMRDEIAKAVAKPLREARVEIDLTRLAANLGRLREAVGVGCAVYAVIKGDGYGAGLVPSARAL